MPVRILYNEMKDAPAPLVADIYKKTIVPSIEKESYSVYLEIIKPLKYKYEITDTEEKCIFDNWRDIKNDLYFTKGYTEIFKNNPISGLWIAYESLNQIFTKHPGPDFHIGYMQVFYYGRKKFWVTAEAGNIVFSTLAEY